MPRKLFGHFLSANMLVKIHDIFVQILVLTMLSVIWISLWTMIQRADIHRAQHKLDMEREKAVSPAEGSSMLTPYGKDSLDRPYGTFDQPVPETQDDDAEIVDILESRSME